MSCARDQRVLYGGARPGYTWRMRVKAIVRNGKIELEPAVTLPEGTELSLVTVDEEDDLDDSERARLHASIEAAEDQLARGEGVSEGQALRQIFGSKR
jgi:hypothetical protein